MDSTNANCTNDGCDQMAQVKQKSALRRFAEAELGESDTNREKGVQELLKYISEHPDLGARTDERSLLIFLRCCKYNVENAKEKLKKFYEMKARMPEWFTNRDPRQKHLLELIKLGVFLPVIPIGEGPLVVIIRTAIHNPHRHQQTDVFKVGKMLLDLAIRDFEETSIYGVHAVLDMRAVSYGHAKQLTPHIIKQAVTAWHTYHCRPQSLDFINAPSYINVVLNVFRAFMTQKMKRRVHVHPASEECKHLHQSISPSRLPIEYGGTNGSLEDLADFWAEKAVENAEWFLDDEQYKAELAQ